MKRLPFALVLVFATFAVACAAQQAGEAEIPAATISTEEAGLELVTLPADSSTVSFAIGFRAGSRDDPEGQEGLTALTAALVAEGSTQKQSYSRLLELLFPMAAGIGYSVDRDLTVFRGRVHVDHLEAFYTILREVLLQPGLAPVDFERLRARALSTVTRSLRTGDDEELGKAVLQAALYDGHPYAHPEIGTEGALGALTLDDVRAHRGRVFCRERALIGLAGALPAGFAERVRGDFEALPSCPGPRAALPSPPPLPEHRVWLVDKPVADSTAISFGFPIDLNRDHPDYAALYLAAAWLGQHRNSVSHLFKKIREERGLNYGDYAYIEWWPRGGRTTLPPVGAVREQQFFHVWIRPVPHPARHFALRAAVRELAGLVTTGLSEEQFEEIRTFISRYVSFYTMSEERRLGYTVDDHYLGLERPSLEALREAWAGLTRDELNAAIRRHLRADRLCVAAITRDAKGFADALAAEAPSPITYASEKPEEILREDLIIQEFRLGITPEQIRILPADELFR